MCGPDNRVRVRKNLNPLDWGVQTRSMKCSQENYSQAIHKQIPRFMTVCGNKKTVMGQLTTR